MNRGTFFVTFTDTPTRARCDDDDPHRPQPERATEAGPPHLGGDVGPGGSA